LRRREEKSGSEKKRGREGTSEGWAARERRERMKEEAWALEM